MQTLLFKALRKLLHPKIGQQQYQQLFYEMYLLSLEGMNYGKGSEVEYSGEIQAMNYIKSRVAKHPTIFDVGANEGQFAENLHSVFGSDITLYCFEPSFAVFEKLKQNLSHIPAILIPLGLSDRQESLPLFTCSVTSLMNSLYERKTDHFNLSMQTEETIELTTLDYFCNEHKINRIDFLKLDIEGHEFAALQGAKQMIENGLIQFIQFEFGGCNIDSKVFFQNFWYLLHERYNLYRIIKDGLCPIKKYEEHFEIFELTNYLAELK